MKTYNWLTQNSKIKKMTGVKTYNWGIPAYKSQSGFRTCPNAAACAIGCYATMGAYTFSNVAKVFEARLVLSKSDAFVRVISAELTRRQVKRLRVHDSGDFYNEEYLLKWFNIMRRHPHVQFYAYTKMVTLIKKYQRLGLAPANFTVVFSQGGTQDKLINTKSDRHSRVFVDVKSLKQARYADAHVNDSVAVGRNPKIGLVYHGTKSYVNTNWNKVIPNTRGDK